MRTTRLIGAGDLSADLPADLTRRWLQQVLNSEVSSLSCLPAELLTRVAEALNAQCLANFAAVCTECLAAAHCPLRATLLAVWLCRERAWVCDALVACPYFWTTVLPHDNCDDEKTQYDQTVLPPARPIAAIPAHFFEGCTSLTSIALPATLTTIGNYAFSGCIRLTHVALPATVTTIRCGAFCGCISIRRLALPAALTTFGACKCCSAFPLPNAVPLQTLRAYKCYSSDLLLEADATRPTALITIGIMSAFHCCLRACDSRDRPDYRGCTCYGATATARKAAARMERMARAAAARTAREAATRKAAATEAAALEATWAAAAAANKARGEMRVAAARTAARMAAQRRAEFRVQSLFVAPARAAAQSRRAAAARAAAARQAAVRARMLEHAILGLAALTAVVLALLESGQS